MKENGETKPDQNGIQKCHLTTTVRKHFVASGLEVHASAASDVNFGNKVLGTIHPLRHESPEERPHKVSKYETPKSYLLVFPRNHIGCAATAFRCWHFDFRKKYFYFYLFFFKMKKIFFYFFS